MEYFNNKEYFDNEHSKFKQEMLSLGYVQEDCMWVRTLATSSKQDSKQTQGENNEY